MMYQGVLRRGVGPTANKIVAPQSMGGLPGGGSTPPSPSEFLFMLDPSGQERTFGPVLELHDGFILGVNTTVTWRHGEAVIENDLTPTIVYASTGQVKLEVTPWAALKTISAGYDHADGGSLDIPDTPAQYITAIQGLSLATALEILCVSHSPITDGTIFDAVQFTTLEAYQSGLTSLAVPSTIKRLCVEDCNISTAVNLSACTALEDLRAALNEIPSMVFPSVAPNLWHICIRENSFSGGIQSDFTAYPALRDLFAWNTNMAGVLEVPAFIENIMVSNNSITALDFSLGGTALDFIDLRNNSVADVDQIVNDLAGWELPDGTLNIEGGSNGTRTVASDISLQALKDAGWAIGINESQRLTFISSGDVVSPTVAFSSSQAFTWHWSDGTTTSGTGLSSSPTKSGLGAGAHAHYLTCETWGLVADFGGVAGYASHITSIGDLNIASDLAILRLYENGECLSVGRLNQCSSLGQFHLAGSGLTNECLDQLFADMVAASATPVAWYAPNVNNGTLASHDDRVTLSGRGWTVSLTP